MTIQPLLLEGSFRGIPFNFTSASRTGGRKKVFHEFINSDIVIEEDFGLAPKSLTLNIRISGIEGSYFNNVNAFETALNEEGPGELVHPTFGKVKASVNGNYVLNESTSSLGFAPFTVTFTIIQDRIFLPFVDFKAPSLLDKANRLAIDKELNFANLYGLLDIDSVEQASKYVKDLTGKFKSAQGLIEDPTKGGEFAAQLLGFEKGTFSSSVELARETYELFYSANSFIESANNRFGFFKTLFGFGDDEPEIPRTTLARVQQADNQDIQRSTVQTNAVAFASVAGVEIEYKTDVELNKNASDLQTQFLKVMDDDGTTSNQYNALQELRVLFNKATSNLILDVSRIVEVDIKNETGLSTLVYQYYGFKENTTDFDAIYELIRSLNEFEDSGSIIGTIKLVTEEGL